MRHLHEYDQSDQRWASWCLFWKFSHYLSQNFQRRALITGVQFFSQRCPGQVCNGLTFIVAHMCWHWQGLNREQQETQRCSQTYNGSPLSPTHVKCYSMCLVRCNYTCASLRLIVIANDKQKSVAAGKPARQINIKQFSNLVFAITLKMMNMTKTMMLLRMRMQESRDWVSSQASSGPRGKLGFSSHSLAGTTPDLDSNHLIRDLDPRPRF